MSLMKDGRSGWSGLKWAAGEEKKGKGLLVTAALSLLHQEIFANWSSVITSEAPGSQQEDREGGTTFCSSAFLFQSFSGWKTTSERSTLYHVYRNIWKDKKTSKLNWTPKRTIVLFADCECSLINRTSSILPPKIKKHEMGWSEVVAVKMFCLMSNQWAITLNTCCEL